MAPKVPPKTKTVAPKLVQAPAAAAAAKPVSQEPVKVQTTAVLAASQESVAAPAAVEAKQASQEVAAPASQSVPAPAAVEAEQASQEPVAP